MELRPYLKRFDLFSKLDDDELGKVAAIARAGRYREGTRIVAEGEPGQSLCLIVKGQVRISRHIVGMGEEALALLEEGQYFGEMSILEETERSADAYAHTNCALIIIEREALDALLEGDKELAYSVLWSFVRTLSSRLRETNEKLRSLFSLHGLY